VSRAWPIAAPKTSFAASRRARCHLAAAGALAAEAGINAVQIAPVAERAGIAAGTVYRYFPSKTDLVARWSRRSPSASFGAMRRAADAAPGTALGARRRGHDICGRARSPTAARRSR
jgi:hypothetical protein